TARDGAAKGGQAVLGPLGGSAAMGDVPGHRASFPPEKGYFSVSMSPFTNQRCMITMTATGGSSTVMAAAMMTFHSGSCEPPRGTRASIPTTAVRISVVVVIMSGQRYSSQP